MGAEQNSNDPMKLASGITVVSLSTTALGSLE
jgi:hypothetical protein